MDEKELSTLALEYLQNKQALKGLLARQVAIMDSLVSQGCLPGLRFDLPNGDSVVLKDNFVTKGGVATNAIFRPLQVERWTIE